MKNTLFLILSIGLAIGILTNDTSAQDAQDLHLQFLPEGVRARFGKGKISGKIAIFQ